MGKRKFHEHGKQTKSYIHASRAKRETSNGDHQRAKHKAKLRKLKKCAMVYYAVRIGRVPGVYESRDEYNSQVKCYSGAISKRFKNLASAIEFAYSPPPHPPPPPTDRSKTTSQSKLIENPSHSNTNLCLKPDLCTKSKAKKKIKIELPLCEGWDIVYTDGACKENGNIGSAAGIGVWWGPNDTRNISERCPGLQTNNRAELIALVRVLETTPISKTPLLIRTDSRYSIKCVETWIHCWRERDWRTSTGAPVQNEYLIQYLSLLLSKRAFLSHKVRLEHVRAHRGILGNEAADKLAKHGVGMAEVKERNWKGLTITLEVELESLERERLESIEMEREFTMSEIETSVWDTIEQMQDSDLLSREEQDELSRTQLFL